MKFCIVFCGSLEISNFYTPFVVCKKYSISETRKVNGRSSAAQQALSSHSVPDSVHIGIMLD